ncbi:MAG: TlpA family protein disulfide reductase [Thermotogae bacterium]|nr:TlpA family protein disulfide reductase [Thermotogota bacterium]
MRRRLTVLTLLLAAVLAFYIVRARLSAPPVRVEMREGVLEFWIPRPGTLLLFDYSRDTLVVRSLPVVDNLRYDPEGSIVFYALVGDSVSYDTANRLILSREGETLLASLRRGEGPRHNLRSGFREALKEGDTAVARRELERLKAGEPSPALELVDLVMRFGPFVAHDSLKARRHDPIHRILSGRFGPLYDLLLDYHSSIGDYGEIYRILRPAYDSFPSLMGGRLYDFAWASLRVGDSSSYLRAASILRFVYGDTLLPVWISDDSLRLLLHYDTVPDFTFRTCDGRPISRDDLLGRPTLIAFWDIGCSECVYDARTLRTMAKRFPHIRFLAVVRGKFPEVEGVKTVCDDGTAFRRFGILGVPSHVLVSPTGHIVYRNFGRISHIPTVSPLY